MSQKVVTWTIVALACAIMAASISAQTQVLVVDASNGPGTNFLDLPPAVSAANPGAIVIVRPGTYSAIVVDKGITILGDLGANIGNITTTFQVALRVENLPASQNFTLSDLGFVSDAAPVAAPRGITPQTIGDIAGAA